MDFEGIFDKAALPLAKLSAIAVALYYWERSDIISRMDDDYAKQVKRLKDMPDSEKGSCSLCRAPYPSEIYVTIGGKEVEYIAEQLELLPIPNKLVAEIRIVVAKIWQKRCYWKHHVMKKLSLNQKYAEKVYWTSHGEINVLKIVKDFWLEDTEFPGKYNWLMGNHLFCTALIHSEDKVIGEDFEKMKKKLFQDGEKKNTGDIIAKWILIHGKDQVQTYRRRGRKRSRKIKKSEAGNLFLKCISNRYEFGTKYFWNVLAAKEKNNLITIGAEACIVVLESLFNDSDEWLFKDDSIDGMKIEQILKILFFLINQMTDVQKQDFIVEHHNVIFKALCVTWPYQDLGVLMLLTLWDHIPVKEFELLKSIVINYVNPEKNKERSSYYSDESRYNSLHLRSKFSRRSTLTFAYRSFFNRILRFIMGKNSKESKVMVFIENDFETVAGFYKIEDYVALNIIINDPHLVDYRQRMLEIGVDSLKRCIDYDEHESVNEFFKVVELSPEESKSLKKKINLLHLILISGKIKSADEHLSCISDSHTERDEFKNEINANEICYILFQNNQFKKVADSLEWRFDKEEERKSIKNALAQYIEKRIFNIWCCSNFGSWKKNRRICSNLLKWFFESDEEVLKFKEENLKALNEGLVLKYWNASFFEKNLYNFDKFLKFCLFSNGEIEEMKLRISNNINWWIDTHALENYDVEMIRDLLWWVYGDHKKIDEVIKNYMSSPRGTLLLIKMFKNFTEKTKSRVLNFLDYWVKKSNFSEIKSHLDQFSKTEKEIDVSRVKRLVEKIEKRKRLKDRDFKSDFKVKNYGFFDDDDEDDKGAGEEGFPPSLLNYCGVAPPQPEGSSSKINLDDYIVKKVFNIWCCSYPGSSEINTRICSKLFKWFLKSEEEVVNFKKTKLKAMNEDLISKYWNASFFEKDFTELDKFLEFCSFSNEEIGALKLSISKNINWWIDTYALENYDIEMIRDLLWWVYEDNAKIDEVIKNYMKSPRGTLLLINMFKNFSYRTRHRVLYFLDHWVKKSNFSEVELYLDRFWSSENEVDIRQIKYLLEKMEKDDLKDEDLSSDFKNNYYGFYHDDDDDDDDEEEKGGGEGDAGSAPSSLQSNDEASGYQSEGSSYGLAKVFDSGSNPGSDSDSDIALGNFWNEGEEEVSN